MNIRKLIMESNGKVFSVKFKKRSTGEIRDMVCRLGVTKGLVKNPSKPGVKAEDHGLIVVWELKTGLYKSIPINGIIELRIAGKVFEVKDV